jgi:hypothetical protein
VEYGTHWYFLSSRDFGHGALLVKLNGCFIVNFSMKCSVTVHFFCANLLHLVGHVLRQKYNGAPGYQCTSIYKKIQVMSELLWALISSQLQKDISSKKLQHALDMVICVDCNILEKTGTAT